MATSQHKPRTSHEHWNSIGTTRSSRHEQSRCKIAREDQDHRLRRVGTSAHARGDAAYLDAWLEEAPDDAAGIARALGDIARAKGMSQVAKDAGLSRESLYRALSAEGNPSFATVLKVAKALGVQLHAQAVPGAV